MHSVLSSVALSDNNGKQTIYKAKVVGVDPDKVHAPHFYAHHTFTSVHTCLKQARLHSGALACRVRAADGVRAASIKHGAAHGATHAVHGASMKHGATRVKP